MSAAGDLLEVTRWQKTGPCSSVGSGAPIRVVGWREANRMARKWLARGPDYYVSICRWIDPFSHMRAAHVQGWDALCATAGGRDFLDGPLDAPDYIAAGAFYESRFETGGRANVFPLVAIRGTWL